MSCPDLLLHRKVVVDDWAIGEFGTTDTTYAQQTTRRLVDAQACSWSEVRGPGRLTRADGWGSGCTGPIFSMTASPPQPRRSGEQGG